MCGSGLWVHGVELVAMRLVFYHRIRYFCICYRSLGRVAGKVQVSGMRGSACSSYFPSGGCSMCSVHVRSRGGADILVVAMLVIIGWSQG